MKKTIILGIVAFGMLLCSKGAAFGQNTQSNDLGKALILYYSWSDSGRTERVAKIIQSLTNADIIEIEPVTPFPDLEYRPMTQWVKGQQEQGIQHPIKDIGVDISSYDFIFIGTPVWYQTFSLPIETLLRQTDFRGKSVATFATSQGGPGQVINNMEKAVRNARIRTGNVFDYVDRDNERQLTGKITAWIRDLRR
jgi:flavodoxin